MEGGTTTQSSAKLVLRVLAVADLSGVEWSNLCMRVDTSLMEVGDGSGAALKMGMSAEAA